MWNKLTSFLLSNLIPASIIGSQAISPVVAPPLVDIHVEPLALVSEVSLEEPDIQAKAALIIETHSNEALYTHNVWEPLPIASLTKLMTALVVKEQLDLDIEVTVSSLAAHTGGSRMGLVTGEKILVRNLLKGLLINSGNDAAVALSEATSGTVDDFVTLMNSRTVSLGLAETSFVDPSGINAGNVSSAFEIAHLAKQVFRDPFFSTLMREKKLTVHSTDELFSHQLVNTNRLLGTDIADRIIAGKTGTTPSAGQCLISFIQSSSDRTIMTIILGSSNRYGEMKSLIDWVDAYFVWE